MISFKEHQSHKFVFKLLFIISIISVIYLIFIPLKASSKNQDEFILIDDIHSGMKGVGRTVFTGTKIEEFGVEVIDIIHGTATTYPYILVRLSGDRIENNGGISAGMSGSPVYFNGKLAGAISHAWEMSEHNLCLITPIDTMLTLLSYVGDDNHKVSFRPTINNKIVSLLYGDELKQKLASLAPVSDKENNFLDMNVRKSIDFHYIQSPLLINGFYGRAGVLIKETLKKCGITVIQNISEYHDINPELEIGTDIKKIQPGTAIGVQLSSGDINIMGIGTATYCQDNHVLALGHPFLHHGDVSYLFTSVYIYHSFPSMLMPFKIGAPFLLLGEVIQDRNEGILAKLNKFPSIVSCKINVSDLDQNVVLNAGVKVVPEKEIVQSVVPALLIQTVDNAINRIGLGTGDIRLGFRNAGTGDVLNYNNISYSENDIAVEVSRDLSYILDLLYYNFYEKIDLNEIVIDVTIKKHNKRAHIKEVILKTEDHFPGDEIEAEIIVTPFRQPDENRTVRIKLPENIAPGNAVLIVRGGLSKDIIAEQSITQEEEQYLLDGGWVKIKKYLKEKEKNNQIVAEIILFNDNENSESKGKSGNNNSENNLKVVLDTDFVIDGYQEIFLDIKIRNTKEVE
jgi:hypothetical protein